MNERLKLKKKYKNINKMIHSNISSNINNNLNMLKEIYTSNLNTDCIFREFVITVNNIKYNSFIIFFEALSDSDSINQHIIKPMIEKEHSISNIDLKNCITENIITHRNIEETQSIHDILLKINIGNCALFIDTLDICYIIDTKKNEHRTVSKPINEVAIKGSHVGFVESIQSNVGLLRKFINDENLVLDKYKIGKRSNTACIIGYIQNIADPLIVENVKNKIKNISIDYLLNSAQLEQLIEEHPLSLAPEIISTERPDKIASHLSEGRVCIIVDNSPYVLIVPCTFWDLFHTPEDYNLKFQHSNFIRFIRLIAMFCSLLLPAIYIALTNHHVALIPTDLLFSIAAIEETLPFPLIIEILIMELSLELIREAGIRMPNSIGSSLGIVGAVLLGQATVDAHLVSPMLILVVAITAISSFATPNYSLAFSIRILRFLYILLAATMGFLGVFCGGIIHLIILANMTTFGIPYFVSFDKYNKQPFRDMITLAPIWLNSFRPAFLNSLDKIKSAKYARKWDKKKGNI